MISEDGYTTLRDLRMKDAEGGYEDYSLEQEMEDLGLKEEDSIFSEGYDTGDLQ